MRCRFLHTADIHLGYEQYNLPTRYNDFTDAYFGMIDHALERAVDFVLIAGDLFHRANTDARTLSVAMAGLERLRDQNIPVIAIEGNHDAQHHRKHVSWMEFLCSKGLLTLLHVPAENGIRRVVPFDPIEREGSWVDVAGVRVYGLKYLGAATARALGDIGDDLIAGPNGYTILMLHAGMQGQVPHMHGGLTPAQIAPLRRTIDYLALGHVHKRLQDDWVYNPGSLETNSMEEINWPHGFFEVEVDTDSPDRHHIIPVETPSLRPFVRITDHADDFKTAADFAEHVEGKIAEAKVPDGAVVELYLGGVAAFARQDVPVEELVGAIGVRHNPLTVRVRNQIIRPDVVDVRRHEYQSRQDLERLVIERLVYQEPAYRDRAADWASLILDVKNMVTERQEPASISDHVQRALEVTREPATEG